MSQQGNILVIKQGALGDIILATAAFKAIRTYHPHAHITCLTREAYAPLLKQCPWFDAILIDPKPKPWQLSKLRTLYKRLNSKKFTHVYDLQNATRSSLYWWLFKRPKPKFSGAAKFASHRFILKNHLHLHAFERLKAQLAQMHISLSGLPDITWLEANIQALLPPTAYILIVPGGAPHRPEKRWPAEYYANFANQLHMLQGLTCLLIGTEAERAEIETIQKRAPHCISLLGKTSIAELATLARHAYAAIGNDTGPMHIIAANNTPCLVLFSNASSPEFSAPIGAHVSTLQVANLQDLAPEKVLTQFTQHVSAHDLAAISATALDIM